MPDSLIKGKLVESINGDNQHYSYSCFLVRWGLMTNPSMLNTALALGLSILNTDTC